MRFGLLAGSLAKAAGPLQDRRRASQARDAQAAEQQRRRTLEDMVFQQGQEDRRRRMAHEQTVQPLLDDKLRLEVDALRTPPPTAPVRGTPEYLEAVAAEEAARQGARPKVPDPRLPMREDRLQQNFQQEPAIRHAGLLANAVAQLKASSAQKTPQGDLNMLYGAVKLRDPNAVREGELALNNKARSAHTQLFALWDRVESGRILTDEERQQIMDLVRETVTQQSSLVAPVQARYGKRAREIGADSAFVAPDPFAGVDRGPPADSSTVSDADFSAAWKAGQRTDADITAWLAARRKRP